MLKGRFVLRSARQNLLNGLEVSDPQRRTLLLSFRAIALDRWEPQRCEAEGLIFLSDLLYNRTHETWLSFCPNCKQIDIASDHEHVIQGEALYRVAAALAEDIAGAARRFERSTAGTP